MAAKGAREPITLECTECKRRNYMTEKNKRNKIHNETKIKTLDQNRAIWGQLSNY